MSEPKTKTETLSDEDMVTTPKLSRRMLIAGAGAILVAGALSSAPAFADADDAEMGDTHGDTHEEEARAGDAHEGDDDDGDAEESDADAGDADMGDDEDDEDDDD